MLCPNGHEVASGAKFCPLCGNPVTATCPSGHPIEEDQKFCRTCGAAVGTVSREAGEVVVEREPLLSTPPQESSASEPKGTPVPSVEPPAPDITDVASVPRANGGGAPGVESHGGLWSRQRTRIVLIGVVVLALLAGGIAFAITSSSNSLTTSNAEDQALAKRAALRLSDFPSGWRTKAPSKNTDVSEAAKKIPGCESFNQFNDSLKAQPNSGERPFAIDSNTVNNQVDVYPSAKKANDAYKLFGKSSVSACLQAANSVAAAKSASKTPGVKVASVDAGQLSVEPVGDRTMGYEIVVTFQADAQSQTLTGDFQLVQVGRALTLLVFGGVDDVTRSTLLRAVTDRLRTDQTTPATEVPPTSTTTSTTNPSSKAATSYQLQGGTIIQSGTTTAASKVADVSRGDVVQMICTVQGEEVLSGASSDSSTWIRVTFNGVAGYISDSYLVESRTAPDPAAALPPCRGTTTLPSTAPGPYNVVVNVAIRSGPSTIAAQLGAVPAGASVGVQCAVVGEYVNPGGELTPTSDWDRVTYNGATGYISDAYVTTNTDINAGVIPRC